MIILTLQKNKFCFHRRYNGNHSLSSCSTGFLLGNRAMKLLYRCINNCPALLLGFQVIFFFVVFSDRSLYPSSH